MAGPHFERTLRVCEPHSKGANRHQELALHLKFAKTSLERSNHSSTTLRFSSHMIDCEVCLFLPKTDQLGIVIVIVRLSPVCLSCIMTTMSLEAYRQNGSHTFLSHGH